MSRECVTRRPGKDDNSRRLARHMSVTGTKIAHRHQHQSLDPAAAAAGRISLNTHRERCDLTALSLQQRPCTSHSATTARSLTTSRPQV